MSAQVLSQLGWDQGFAIPVANSENKALEDELQKKQKHKANVENEVVKHKDRIKAMTDHLNNVRQELCHTQALCRAKEKERESEEHFQALAEREKGRLQQEIVQLESELAELREKRNMQENNIFKATQKVEELKCQLNWDQQALEAWLKESAQKDEDAMAIFKYAQQDEGKIKELTLRIERMTVEVNQKRKILDSELTETITAQIELDKTAEDFRQAHLERQELICQWENTIEQMRKRDQEMDNCSLILAQVKQDIREREASIKEKKHFFDSEVENNKECEKKISSAERQAANLRQEYQGQEASRLQLQDELESLKGTVDRTATDLETTRSQLSSIKKDIQEKNYKLNVAKKQNEALAEKLRYVSESAVSEEMRASRMEQILKEEEQTIKEIDSHLNHVREMLFKKTQELQDLNTKEKNRKAEVSGSKTALANLNSRLNKLDNDSLKQQEILYNQDFQIQLLERKMSRLRGDVNTEEKQALEARVEELSKDLQEKKEVVGLLTIQLKKLKDDIRYLRKGTEKTTAEKSDLTCKINDLNLFNDTSEKELKKIRLKKQDSMVEDNILKLEIKRLRDLLYNKAHSVLSLEKRRIQLQTAMKEREEEIKVHSEMLQMQMRLVDQERQGLSSEVHERLSRIDKLRKRYEILMISMAAPEGEEERSQAFYVIKAAQEKEELQRQGNDLDAKISKAEKEIRALENTLHVISSRNTTYRKSFNTVTETNEEHQEKLRLEEQMRAAEENHKYKRRQIKELQEDTQGMKSTLDDLLKEEAALNEKNEEIQSRIINLNRDMESQKEKLERVMRQCSKLTREIRSARKSKGETQEERDISLRELRDFNRSVNTMLLEAMEYHPDLAVALHMYFQQANLALPTPASSPGSRHSSKPGSARSSSSSGRTTISSKSSHRSSAPQGQVKTVELGLGLSVSSPPCSTPSPQGSRPASAARSQQ
ncbi:coiled-coil domain-containing protein 39 [Amia ocellicauda]|uniref:coiled-coil domain-containing protein 39 n=1 Tax=Amia ocellicauda TaxID=2972642 RepID=UPI00346389E2